MIFRSVIGLFFQGLAGDPLQRLPHFVNLSAFVVGDGLKGIARDIQTVRDLFQRRPQRVTLGFELCDFLRLSSIQV